MRFIATDRCNLDGAYCFQKSADDFEMSWEDLERGLARADSPGAGVVGPAGGEPRAGVGRAGGPRGASAGLVLEKRPASD